MSRGPGHWQKQILQAIEAGGSIALSGRTKAETSAARRAGLALQKVGKVVVIRLWNEDSGPSRRVCSYAFPAGFKSRGRPIEELSVDLVTHGTRSTFKGSIRDIAADRIVGASRSTVWRWLKQVAEPKATGQE